MHTEDFFVQSLIYLLAAVISVPLAKRAGLGSVLGYLLAGILIGPFVLGLVGKEDTDIMHFAEFGVVMMLFLIGLELKPALLWKMRRSIFGLGGLQVFISTLIIAGIARAFNMSINQSIAIGLILALSSTAIVLQTLNEKKLIKTPAGQSSFSVLLFQDIAVIPILAILPLLAGQVDSSGADAHAEELVGVAALPGWQQVLIILLVVGSIIFVGRYFARYIFRFIAETGIREIFTAAALLMVVAIAIAMNSVGISPALGTFLAGVVLADSEYRHELESDIEPFKGLLLGLFFIAVGSSINFSILAQQPLLIIGLLAMLIAVKFIVLYVLGRIYKLKFGQEMLFSFALAQAGEFAFVLISFSTQNAIFGEEISNILLIVVALSMLLTPLLMIINDRWVQPAFERNENQEEADHIDENDNQVIIAGYGRFGVVIGRFLKANQIRATILDSDPRNVELLRKFGHDVFYGDITRPDLLEMAGAAKAKVLIVALNDREAISYLAKYAHHKYPNLKVFARAVDVRHTFELTDLQAAGFRRDTYDSGLELGVDALTALGVNRYRAKRSARSFKYNDEIIMSELYTIYKDETDSKKYMSEVRRFSDQLEKVLMAEQDHSTHEVDAAWDVDSRREEIIEMYKEQQE